MKESDSRENEAPVNSFESLAPAISKYFERIGNYLDSINARLEVYKFDVTKLENGIAIDLDIKVKIQTETSTTKQD
jgi:hypothetical protein